MNCLEVLDVLFQGLKASLVHGALWNKFSAFQEGKKMVSFTIFGHQISRTR
jgi:hypothetical protein